MCLVLIPHIVSHHLFCSIDHFVWELFTIDFDWFALDPIASAVVIVSEHRLFSVRTSSGLAWGGFHDFTKMTRLSQVSTWARIKSIFKVLRWRNWFCCRHSWKWILYDDQLEKSSLPVNCRFYHFFCCHHHHCHYQFDHSSPLLLSRAQCPDNEVGKYRLTCACLPLPPTPPLAPIGQTVICMICQHCSLWSFRARSIVMWSNTTPSPPFGRGKWRRATTNAISAPTWCAALLVAGHGICLPFSHQNNSVPVDTGQCWMNGMIDQLPEPHRHHLCQSADRFLLRSVCLFSFYPLFFAFLLPKSLMPYPMDGMARRVILKWTETIDLLSAHLFDTGPNVIACSGWHTTQRHVPSIAHLFP